MTGTEAPGRPTNRLLRALAVDEYDRISPHLEPVRLELKQTLYKPNAPIEFVYFLQHGIVSIVSIMKNLATVEIATVGNEGMIGLPVFLGAEAAPVEAFCQVAGEALRMPSEQFRQATRNGGTLSMLLSRYTQALLTQIAQSAACNRVHSINERCARWLLMTHDRVGRDDFGLTQEFLAQMLGVRRASVSSAASILQRAGYIEYVRGHITVMDRHGLESAACECYWVVKEQFDQLTP